MSLTSVDRSVLHCSFCDKPSTEVTKLIAGPGVYICDRCVEACAGILTGQGALPGPAGDTALAIWESQSDEEVLAALPRMAVVSAQVDARVRTLVDVLRGRGVSWSVIGEALGVTRQSAWERFSG